MFDFIKKEEKECFTTQPASKQDIVKWINEAVKNNAAYLIVVYDSFDYGDYPVYCSSKEECLEKFDEFNDKNMQKVMEVYDLSLNINDQLNEERAFHLPEK